MFDFIIDFAADWIEGILELGTKPWVDRMSRKWKARKKKKIDQDLTKENEYGHSVGTHNGA